MYNDEFLDSFMDFDGEFVLWDYNLFGQDEIDVFDIWCMGCEL